jgi:phosphoribosyl 1,2-cyclic phosphate phosphodiesterase
LSHFNLQEALDFIEDVKPEKAYLTHISHLFGKHADIEKELPSNVFLAYDGLVFDDI